MSAAAVLPRVLAGLAVGPMSTAVGAVLLQLQAVGVVPPVLPRDVVAVLTLLAGQRDLRPYVGGSHDGVPFWARDMDMRCDPRPPRRTVADATLPSRPDAGTGGQGSTDART